MSAEKEIELAWLIEIGDFAGLSEADSFEHHLQFEYKLPDKEDGSRRGKVRVRKNTKGTEVDFKETIKVPHDETTLGDDEYTTEISESYFNAWVKTFGNKGVSKTRYNFVAKSVNITGNGVSLTGVPVTLEVDVFLNNEGKRFKYAKLDVEVHGLLETVKAQNLDIKNLDIKIDLTSLPLKVGQIIPLGGKDPVHQKFIDEFFAATTTITG